MRHRDLVSAERRTLAAYRHRTAEPEFLRFLDGAGAALDWVAGVTDLGPVSGVRGPGDAGRCAGEVGVCDALLARYPADGYRRPGPEAPFDPHFVNGVEHALCWVLGREGEPPVPLRPGAAGARRPLAARTGPDVPGHGRLSA